jgi:hypothetical protein
VVGKRTLLAGAALVSTLMSPPRSAAAAAAGGAIAAEARSMMSPKHAQWAERVAAAMEAGPVPTDAGRVGGEGGEWSGRQGGG